MKARDTCKYVRFCFQKGNCGVLCEKYHDLSLMHGICDAHQWENESERCARLDQAAAA